MVLGLRQFIIFLYCVKSNSRQLFPDRKAQPCSKFLKIIFGVKPSSSTTAEVVLEMTALCFKDGTLLVTSFFSLPLCSLSPSDFFFASVVAAAALVAVTFFFLKTPPTDLSSIANVSFIRMLLLLMLAFLMFLVNSLITVVELFNSIPTVSLPVVAFEDPFLDLFTVISLLL